jgi:uncharacterized protein
MKDKILSLIGILVIIFALYLFFSNSNNKILQKEDNGIFNNIENTIPELRNDIQTEEKTYSSVLIDDIEVKIDIADNDVLRTQGLSGRKSLKDGEGMFFIFDDPDFYRIWMKDMNFPIDIIFISADFKILSIENNISPDTYPQTFTSKEKSKYILEVNANFSSKNNFQVGDFVKFLP